MTIEQAPNRAPNDDDLREIIERAKPEEVAAFIEKNRIREGIDENLEERGDVSAEYAAQKAQENADLSTFALDTTKSVDDRVAHLKANLGGASGVSSVDGLVETAEQKAKAFAKGKILEQVEGIPFIGKWVAGFFGDIDGDMGVVKKGIFGGILSFLGIAGGKKFLDGDYSDFKMPEVVPPVVDVPEVVVSEVDVPPGEEEDLEKGGDEITLNEKLKTYSTIGKGAIRKLGGYEFGSNDNFDYTITESIKLGLSYRDYSQLKHEDIEGGTIEKENFERTQKATTSDSMVIVFDSFLSPENIGALLNKDSSREKLYAMGIETADNFKWVDMELGKLLQLLAISIAGVSYGAIMTTGQFGSDVLNQVVSFGSNTDVKEMRRVFVDEIKEFEKEVMPSELIVKFALPHFEGNRSFSDEIEVVKEKAGIDNDEFDTYLIRIIELRNFIEETILSDNKYTLGDSANIKDSVNMRDVAELYLSLQGKLPEVKDGKIVDPMASSIIYPWIAQSLINNDRYGAYNQKLFAITIGDLEKGEFHSENEGLLRVMLGSFATGMLNDATGKLKNGAEALKGYFEQNPYEVAGLAAAALLINKAKFLKYVPYGRIIALGSVAVAYFLNRVDDENRSEAAERLKDQGGEAPKIVEEGQRLLNEVLALGKN